MLFKNTFASGFVIALILVAGMFSYILAHETTHLLLADEAYGICFGRCRYNSPNVVPSTGIAFAASIGKHNDNSVQELFPNMAGLATMIFVIFIGIFCFHSVKR